MWPVCSHGKYCDVDYSESMQADQVHYRRGKMHWRLGATFRNGPTAVVCPMCTFPLLKVYVCGKDATSSALEGAREITAASADKLVINVRIFRNGGRFCKVGIATRYGLDDSGIESSWGWNFTCPSRPAPKPTHALVQWVLGVPLGVNLPGHGADHPLPSSPELANGLEL
jgi:hypothetical protein